MPTPAENTPRGESIDFEGEAYHVYPQCDATCDAFREWVVAQAWEQLGKAAKFMSPLELAEARGQLVRDMAAQRFDWNGDVCQDARLSAPGMRQELLIRLRANHGPAKVTADLVRRLFEATPFVRLLAVLGYPLREGADPKAPPPGGGSPG